MGYKCYLRCVRWGLVLGAMLLNVMVWTRSGVAQQTSNRTQLSLTGATKTSAKGAQDDSLRDLREQVRELQEAVAGMRSDWQRSRAESAELRRELDELRGNAQPRNAVLRAAVTTSMSFASPVIAPPVIAPPNNGSQINGSQINALQDDRPIQKEVQKNTGHAASAEEEYQLLSGKVDEQYQTKVESASKYKVRLSGIVLMNLFSTQGVVDNIDLPMLAYARPAGDSGGSFGATLRQSEIGFETFGPTLAGARTRADLQLDLAGGFPSVPNGINSGLVRLRTATMRMDWTNTSVVAGQDEIFFSPNSPTSFASLAMPALSGAGNLWGWIPQIRVEHRLPVGEQSNLIFQAGLLDPVTGEAPNRSYRGAGPGEESRQPAYATRIAWTHSLDGQPLRVGVAGYYNRQDYGFDRNVDGWAGMADLELPLGRQFSLSGEFYRGKALGGLYGGIGRSVLFSGDPTVATTEVQGLDSIGGWAQLKYRPTIKWEFNAAFGMDNPYASDVKYFPYSVAYGDPTLAKNQAGFANFIYRPRSDLLFSAEYRRLTTYSLIDGGSSAGQLNLMMGVLF